MVVCNCGRRAIIKTSLTNINPGRRFCTCPKKDSVCPFIGFLDPPMCQRAVVIILRILRARNHLEATLRQAQEDRARFRNYLLLSWLAFGLLVLVNILT